MYPVHDADAILLLSLSLAAKRRPADLVEICAAADLLQGVIPNPAKVSDSFARLSAYGLILEVNGGYTLNADAQQMMEGMRKRDTIEQRIHMLKELLAEYHLQGEHVTLQVSETALSAATLAHRAALNSIAKNMLVPKPKPVEDPRKRPAKYQSFSAKRAAARRKD